MTPSRGRLPQVVGALVAAVVLIGGCSGGKPATDGAHGTSRSPGASASQADKAFLLTMVSNHTQTIEIAGLAKGRSRDSRVLQLADRTATDRRSDLTTITAWLSDWGVLSSARSGATTAQAPAADLTAASGPPFDRLFVERLIELYSSAIAAARTEVAGGHDPGTRAMAVDITSTYAAAVIEMAQLRTDLGG